MGSNTHIEEKRQLKTDSVLFFFRGCGGEGGVGVGVQVAVVVGVGAPGVGKTIIFCSNSCQAT